MDSFTLVILLEILSQWVLDARRKFRLRRKQTVWDMSLHFYCLVQFSNYQYEFNLLIGNQACALGLTSSDGEFKPSSFIGCVTYMHKSAPFCSFLGPSCIYD